ncbi:procathepsin L-like [Heptranchias perlo]|uniref:procathepsin L-like n=1 Tax=Heptranchias perlo TaxID=212740 RepID=UPI00355AC2F9
MKFPLFVDCVVVFVLAAASVPTFDPTLDEGWMSWKSQHEKQYKEDEETYRRMIWENNVRYVEQHNLEYSMGKHTFTVGMNQFGDLTTEEFNQRLNGFNEMEAENSTYKVFAAPENFELPATIDWRKKGYVTPVKSQGDCLSCWAFGATGALEGQLFKKTRKLISLSEQNLVDCDKKSHGCSGGFVHSALEYVQHNGINSEKRYPYVAMVGQRCKFNKNDIVTNCNGVEIIPKNSETLLACAVTMVGPISVAVDASHESFMLYKSGIYNEPKCSSTKPNHAMLVVGYGIDKGRKYWIVKNSWNKTWGIQGYVHMAKDKENHCAIAKTAMFPVM